MVNKNVIKANKIILMKIEKYNFLTVCFRSDKILKLSKGKQIKYILKAYSIILIISLIFVNKLEICFIKKCKIEEYKIKMIIE